MCQIISCKPKQNNCLVSFEIKNTIKGPLNVYLSYENFYQSFKPFADSVPLYQLSGHKTTHLKKNQRIKTHLQQLLIE